MFPANDRLNEWIKEYQRNRLKISVKVFGYLGISILLILCGKWLTDESVPFNDQRPTTRIHSSRERDLRILRQHPNFPLTNREKLPDPNLKTILLWSSWFDWDPAFFFGVGRQPFIDADCPVTTCFISNQRYLMPPSEYDAILFFFPMVMIGN